MAKHFTGSILALAVIVAANVLPAAAEDAAKGQALAFDRGKGNCLACHAMKGGDVASNVGPKLEDLKARFPDPRDLQAIVSNEQARNPQTVMPAFGKNLILNDQEIKDVVAFLYTL